MITSKRHADWSVFDVIGMENQITCNKAQMLPKLKVTGMLIEEICSPSSPRLEPVKLKPHRDLCTFPAVGVAPPCLYGGDPYTWTHGMKLLQFSLEEQRWCGVIQVLNPTGYTFVQGLSNCVSHTDVVTVVLYDTDLGLLMDTKTKGWCDRIARGRDIHTYRLVRANSVEERLLKKSIKHMIQELAARGGDCSTDLLSQACLGTGDMCSQLKSVEILNCQLIEKIKRSWIMIVMSLTPVTMFITLQSNEKIIA